MSICMWKKLAGAVSFCDSTPINDTDRHWYLSSKYWLRAWPKDCTYPALSKNFHSMVNVHGAGAHNQRKHIPQSGSCAIKGCTWPALSKNYFPSKCWRQVTLRDHFLPDPDPMIGKESEAKNSKIVCAWNHFWQKYARRTKYIKGRRTEKFTACALRACAANFLHL